MMDKAVMDRKRRPLTMNHHYELRKWEEHLNSVKKEN
jgi:hypothetical protein